MATTLTKYAVYVSEDNGWANNCPDYQGVFFGDVMAAGGRYVSPRDSELGGHAEFDSEDEAEDFRWELDQSGDWTPYGETEERRPTYDVVPIDA